MRSRGQKAKAVKSVATSAKKKSRLSFFGDAVEELKKARWPTRQETVRLSIIVLIVCVVIGVILGALDYGFSKFFVDFILAG